MEILIKNNDELDMKSLLKYAEDKELVVVYSASFYCRLSEKEINLIAYYK